MTEEHLDRMVRDADPYRPDLLGHLDGAEQTLLEEIMSEPTLTPVAEPPQPPGRPRRTVVRRLAGVFAAAAVLTGALVVPGLLRADPDGGRSGPAAGAPDPAGDPSASGAPVRYSPVALKAAEQNPRLLIDQPGWRATTVYGFTDQQGTIAFRNGDREVEMNWYPAAEYANFRADRLNVSDPEPVTVDGWSGDLFTYRADDFAVMLRPRDGVFVEMRGGVGHRADFDKVLARVVRADVRTWLAALPPEIVTPDRVDDRAAAVLAGVPLPPNFDQAALASLGTNDAYQFGAGVTSKVGCGWIAEWLRADRAGDEAARRRAADALRSSHNWRVLHEMKDEGDWPEVFWETADKVAAGQVPAGYAQGLGCD
ncbi:hypothetical protein [Micromonospora sp. HK10]|uniref:hypothetical protein n=1 Tax=Micromonospora sp. HK10 TaxID=1538294 RepID=UPI00062718D4|nr:hypothetical protein [Micromonospora sp. HK10]KKK07220.1 hypothetical protein LQ51_03975 [Micromonospora sp. HK10]